MFNSVFISEFLIKFSWLGGWVFLFLAFLESIPLIGLVIPGATIISIGGFLASQGYINVWYVALFAVSGAIIGDLLNYCLGRTNSNLIKNKKIVSETLLANGENFFTEYGGGSLFLGRFLGPLKQVIPFIAGIYRMKFDLFILWDFIGILSWALVYTFLGYFFGTIIGSLLKKWTNDFILLLVILLVIYLLIKLVKNVYFKAVNPGFLNHLCRFTWLNRLNRRFPVISGFLRENEKAIEKSIGGILLLILLMAFYFLFY